MFTQYMTLFHSLFNSLSQAHSSTTTRTMTTISVECKNGHKTTIDLTKKRQDGPTSDNSNRGVSCSTCDRNAKSCKPSVTTGCLGKRTADVSSQTEKVVEKKTRLRGVVQDTVLNMMKEWYLEENWLLEDDNSNMQAVLDNQAKVIADLRRQLARKEQQQHLHAVQLNACHRYSRMVETWCPQVREMFNGDLEAMLELQREQQWDLEIEWDHENRLLRDNEETEDEE